MLRNIIEHGYYGALWVINPNAAFVSGLPSYGSVADLPGIPELAIIAIPAQFVASSLEDFARKGTKAVIILTSGFGEKDEKGKKEEQRLLTIANDANMILIGPNCSGFMTPHYSGKFAGIIPELKPGSVDFISGSGATVDLVMEQAIQRGLSFCNVVNVGNSVQTGVEDLVVLYDEHYGHESAPILMLYLESIKKPGLLLKHARNLTQNGCAIVGIKSGVSGAGARAAASHTGAIATDDTFVDALFGKAGIIRVKSKMEMIDVACALSATGGRLRGNRACVITDAGGPGVMLTDELERQGFVLPVLGEITRERLHQILPPESSVANPIDCLPTRTASQIKEIFRIIEEEEKGDIDVIAIQMGNPGMSHNREIYGAVSRAVDNCTIPVIPVLSSVTTCAKLIREFTADGKFYFQDEVNLGTALGRVLYRPAIFEASGKLSNYDILGIEEILRGQKGALNAKSVMEVLGKAGFSLPRQIEVTSVEQLKGACQKVGYPLAMKVSGPLHKSDLGGVMVGVKNWGAARSAWDELIAIRCATGVLIQQMVEGVEVILGATRADNSGHLVMFGLGGIYTEVLKDVRFALTPIAKEECLEMVTGIKGYPILEGLRGQKGMSVDLLTDYIERIGRLVTDFPAINEIDLNPVKGFGADLNVVDARIIMDL